MQAFKKYVTINLISFALVTISFVIIVWFVPQEQRIRLGPFFLTSYSLTAVFVCTTITSILMYITDKIAERFEISPKAFWLVDIFVTIYVIGHLLLGIVPMNSTGALIMAGLLLIIYLIVCWITNVKDKNDAKKINEILKERRSKKEDVTDTEK